MALLDIIYLAFYLSLPILSKSSTFCKLVNMSNCHLRLPGIFIKSVATHGVATSVINEAYITEIAAD